MIRSYQGHTPVIPESCYVDVSAQVLGDVVLGEHSSIWMNAVVRGDVNSIRVGSNSNIQDCAVLHGMRYVYPVIVGDHVTIGHNATVHGCVIEDCMPDRDRCGDFEQRTHRRGIDYRGGRGDWREYEDSTTIAGGGCARQGATRAEFG